MKLGIVTYNIAADWDCDTLIAKCEELGYAGVELRTTHAHGVEVSLAPHERRSIRKKFTDSRVKLVGLGSAFEFHSPDEDELKRNIEGTEEYIILAHDVGAEGVKVRPNAFPEGVSQEKPIEQIGRSLADIGEFGAERGVKIRVEVHGHGTCDPKAVKKMIDIADHPNVYVCWNSNMQDLDETGSIDAHFALLKDKIDICHINQMWNDYPWQHLFELLTRHGFDGFCLAEIQGSADPDGVLNYYRKLFQTFLANC